jgi:hypothetical protein
MIKNKPGSPGQHQHIDQIGHDFGPSVPKGIKHRGTFAANTKGDTGNQYCREITEIMHGIRNQGYAVDHNTADDLGHQNDQVQPKRDQQP